MKLTNTTYSGSKVEHPEQSTTPSRSGLCMTISYPIIRRNACTAWASSRQAECGRYDTIPCIVVGVYPHGFVVGWSNNKVV